MLKNKIILLLGFLLPCAAGYSQNYELPLPEDGQYVYFSADELDYNEDAALLKLLGDVVVVHSDPVRGDTSFYSENLLINPKTQSVKTEGDVRIESAQGAFTGKNFEGDYAAKNFKIQDIKAAAPPVRILHADEAEYEDGAQTYRGARMTCCEFDDPHYTVGVGYAHVTQGNRLYIANSVLYIGKIPVMYLPIFWRSLGSKKPFTTYVDFTQSGKTGFGLLTSTVFYPVDSLRTTINLDYYTKSSLGAGAQVMAADSANFRGNAEVYGIDDKEAEDTRWGARGGYWWQIADSSDALNEKDGAIYTSQAQFRAVSDPYFNDTFFRDNPYAFMPDQDISVALSRQSRASILRLSYLQKNEFNFLADDFEITQKTLPRLEYQLMPFALGKTGIISNMSLAAYNTEEYNEGFKQSAHARWNSSRAFRLNRHQTFTPYIMFAETLTIKDSNYDDKDAWVSRVGGGANLRTALITGDLDISYRYTKRLSTGAITSDTVSADRGEEENLVYVQNYWRPSPYYYLRVGAGYNLGNDGEGWDFKERLAPVLAEAGINTYNNGFNLFAQNLYDVTDGNEAFIFNTNFRVKGESRLSFGMTNYETTKHDYTYQARFRLLPGSSTWGVDAGADFNINGGSFDIFSKHIKVYKNFHDAAVMFGVEDRNNNLSFTFRINVLCGDKGRSAIHSKEDEYWNPWRVPGDLR